MRGYRIGAGTGFAGDRMDPAVVLAERGDLDALVFECLAERTIGLAQKAMVSGGIGYDGRLLDRLALVLPHTAPRGTIITTNAGAADPIGAARAVTALAGDLGLDRLRVAAVTGDDVLGRLDPASPILGTSDTIGDLGDRIVSANAYLGAGGIREALERDAQIVITGRVGDAALFAAPIAHRFGWQQDDLERMADATIIGHLLECAGQLTGGYFADGSRKQVPDLAHLGFPLAEVAGDGSAVYTKVDGTGGLIDRRTVLEQLLYEIDDAAAYLTPDVALDMSRVTIDEVAENRVRVAGATPNGRPEQLKVSVGVRDGRLAVAEIVYSGSGAMERAALAERIVRERWTDVHGRDDADLRCDFVGLNATRAWWDGAPDPAEVRVRFTNRSFDESDGRTLCDEVDALYTNGPAGGGGVTTSVNETVGIVSTMVDRDMVDRKVTVIE